MLSLARGTASQHNTKAALACGPIVVNKARSPPSRHGYRLIRRNDPPHEGRRSVEIGNAGDGDEGDDSSVASTYGPHGWDYSRENGDLE